MSLHITDRFGGSDRRGNLGITAYQDPAVFGNRYMAIVSQPRTIGLKIGYSFKE
jgi:hypothetical protein